MAVTRSALVLLDIRRRSDAGDQLARRSPTLGDALDGQTVGHGKGRRVGLGKDLELMMIDGSRGRRHGERADARERASVVVAVVSCCCSETGGGACLGVGVAGVVDRMKREGRGGSGSGWDKVQVETASGRGQGRHDTALIGRAP